MTSLVKSSDDVMDKTIKVDSLLVGDRNALLIAAIVVTAYVFYTAKNKPQIYDLKSFKDKD